MPDGHSILVSGLAEGKSGNLAFAWSQHGTRSVARPIGQRVEI